jgi:hypothetical protein
MKLFGRRKTFAVAAGAPLVMVSGMSQQNHPGPPPQPPYWNTSGTGGGIMDSIVTPPKWRDFCAARDELYKQRALQHEVHNTHVFDLNIQALRSVSTQHKARMQIESHRRAQREGKGILESLARQLNVWDFWKEREKTQYGDNAAQTSRY